MMKHSLRLLRLLLVCLFAAMLVTAVSAERFPGFYELGENAAITVTPDGTLTPDEEKTGYYAQSETLTVTLPQTTAGKYYLALLVDGNSLPTAESQIQYVGVAAASSTSLTMQVSPILEESTSMTLYITSNASGFTTVSVPMKYYVPLELGDVDADRSLTAADASLALQYYVDSEEAALGTEQCEVADVNGDSAVNTVDAWMILRHCVGLCGADCPLGQED